MKLTQPCLLFLLALVVKVAAQLDTIVDESNIIEERNTDFSQHFENMQERHDKDHGDEHWKWKSAGHKKGKQQQHHHHDRPEQWGGNHPEKHHGKDRDHHHGWHHPKQPWHQKPEHGKKPWHNKPLPTWTKSQPPPYWTQTQSPHPQPTGDKPHGHVCKHHHHCKSGHCSKKRCCPKVKKGKKGDYCNMSNQCKTELFCNHSKCDHKRKLGHKCYKNVGCESGNCVSGKCIADHSVKKGGKCSRSVQCIGKNFCNRTYCKPLQHKGKYCYKDNGCFSKKCRASKCA